MQNTQVTGKWSFGKVAFYALCLFGLYKVCKKRQPAESVGQCVRTPETVQDRNQEQKEVRKQFEMRLQRVYYNKESSIKSRSTKRRPESVEKSKSSENSATLTND